jgi:hypothetical protein
VKHIKTLTLLAALVASCAMQPAPADDNEASDDNTANVAAAIPGGVPVMYFGVNSCGVTIIWLTMADGHMFRLDPTHHLANMDGFMKSIANLPHDVVVIPCPAQL